MLATLQRVVAVDRTPRGPSREEDEEDLRCLSQPSISVDQS